MNGFIRIVIIAGLLFLVGCASDQTQSDDVASADATANAADTPAPSDADSQLAASSDKASDQKDDFGDFDNNQAKAEDKSATTNPVENEMQNAQDVPPAPPGEPSQLAQNDAVIPPPPELTPEPIPAPVVTEPAPITSEVIPNVTPDPVEKSVAAPSMNTVEITGLKFQPNDNGGTVVIQATGPVTYTTRANPDLKQFVVEVENAHLPEKLTRSLNTKDIKGAIGTVDAYQNSGSNIARFVIQMRDGVGNPTVQSEGNQLLIVSSLSGSDVVPVASKDKAAEELDPATAQEKILSSQSLSDYLAGNTQFYGKKISIETNSMDIRDVLHLITEESGLNMVISEEVKGGVSLKLRQVPWDQALVIILKMKKLGYSRQGNILRIVPIADLKQEEDDATKLVASKKAIEPLKIRMFPVNYAKVDELSIKVKDFLSDQGKVVGDSRTNSLVITDKEDNLNRVAKLIASLDVQPPQVLIEGKIVEANDTFVKNMGVSWGTTGDQINLGTGKNGPINMRPTLNTNSGGAGTGNFVLGLQIGTLDILGDLTAALSLSERSGNAKVISSPRIVAITNEKASISQVTEVPFRSISVSNGVQQISYQFKPLSLKLDVTPQITSDASIIMNVDVNRQFLGSIVDLNTEAAPVYSRQATTKVIVKNAQTTVIGGVYQSDVTDSDQGVPGAKDLPFIGSLFSVKNHTKTKVELVIFLTPRILGQNETSGAAKTQDF